MKRLICLILAILCVTAVFAGCQKEPLDDQTTAPETDTTAPESDTTAPQTLADLDIDPSKNTEPKPTKPAVPTYPTNEDGLPEYVPGTIWLDDQNLYEVPFERKYRLAYYFLSARYVDLLTDEQQDQWYDHLEKLEKETNWGEFQEEMLLVTLVKMFDIPRETFEAAVNEEIAINQKLGISMTSEWNEVPNVDIIYTFDNEIINNFYRYE